MSRLMIVSNRLPFSIERAGEKVNVRQSSGGLVSAIKSFLEHQHTTESDHTEQLWVGTLETTEEEWLLAQRSGSFDFDYDIQPIFADKAVYDDYYNGFSNST